MKKVIIYLIIASVAFFVLITIIGVITEPESSRQNHKLNSIIETINSAEKTADLEAALTQLTDLRGQTSDNTLAARADSTLATAGAHRSRVALAEKNSASAYALELAKDVILKRLKSPKTASFSGYSESKYWYYPKDDIYIVQLYVDAQNSFGAMIRQYYQVKLKETAGSWNVAEIAEIDRY